MNHEAHELINRRVFLRGAAFAMALANCSGLSSVEASESLSDISSSLASAATSQAISLAKHLQSISTQISELRNIRIPKDHFTAQECNAVSTILSKKDAAFAAILREELRAAAILLDSATLQGLVDAFQKGGESKGKITFEIKTAIDKCRALLIEGKDAALARAAFLHISKDQSYREKLLTAIRAKNRAAIEELLKRDIPGVDVVVQDAKEDSGVLLSVRIGTFTHCLSSGSQCTGRSATFAK